MRASDETPTLVTPLTTLDQRVRAGQEPCRECRVARAVEIHQRLSSGDVDARDRDPAHRYWRALCTGCGANAARAQQRFAARLALVEKCQAEVRTGLAALRWPSTKTQ